MPSLIVVRPDGVVIMMFVCLRRVLVRSKTPASLRLLFLEVPQHDKTVLLLYQKYVFLLKRARRFQGSPTPGMPSFVKCSCCVCCNPMAATSPPPARASQSRKTISYQFRCAVVVYIMAGAGVVRLRWCSWLTNNLIRGGSSLYPTRELVLQENPAYVQ